MWYVPSRFHQRPTSTAARVQTGEIVSVILVLAALGTSIALVVSDSSQAFRHSRERELLSAVPLIAIGLACLVFHATWKPKALELTKRILLSAAFFFWAATQLALNAGWAPVANDAAIGLFVLELALVLWTDLLRQSGSR
jgi:hypothetical protein